MDRTVADEYKSSLNDLNFNSKPHISMLTMLADENKKHAPLIVNAIINHINSVSMIFYEFNFVYVSLLSKFISKI